MGGRSLVALTILRPPPIFLYLGRGIVVYTILRPPRTFLKKILGARHAFLVKKSYKKAKKPIKSPNWNKLVPTYVGRVCNG